MRKRNMFLYENFTELSQTLCDQGQGRCVDKLRLKQDLSAENG